MSKHFYIIILLSLLIGILITKYYMLTNPILPIEFEYKHHDYIFLVKESSIPQSANNVH